jgi:hypothetical protein
LAKLTETWQEASMECPYLKMLISSQSVVHLADGFQRRRLKCEKLTDDRQQMTKQETGPCLLMDRDEMTNLYREGRKHLWNVLI